MPTEMPHENSDVLDATSNGNMETSHVTTNGTKQTNDIDMAESDNIDIEDIEELKDEFCDPQNPIQVHFQDVSAAAYKIRGGVQRTPCSHSQISNLIDMELFFKKDFMQATGSFKERGARYTLLMLSDEYKEKGVMAASAGNHALALAYHARDLGIPAFVVMPIIAPIMKITACKQAGANVLIKGADIGESKKIAMKIAKEKGLFYVNGYDHPHIIAGQGTIGLEIVEQVSDLDAIVIPVGGGGMIAGIALAVKSLSPRTMIIGVESEQCASFSTAMDAGHPIYTKSGPTLADGLAVPTVGVNAYATAHGLIDKMVTVSEDMIALSILRLVELEKCVVEGAGASGFAALLCGKLPELKGKKVCTPLCGGNIDTTVLGRVLERGLAADGRLCRFVVTVSDRPGGIAELTKFIADLGVSIKDIFHERAFLKSEIFHVQVKCVVETRDAEHAESLHEGLKQRYNKVIWGTHLQY